MTCYDCDKETYNIQRIAFNRIGNKDIGWGRQ